MKDVFKNIFHKELAEERAEGRADIISRMLAGGMTPQEVANLIALPLAEVLALRGEA